MTKRDKVGKGLKEFYTEEELIKRFGTAEPTLEQRTEEFKFLWMFFGPEKELDMHEIGAPLGKSVISNIRKEYGPFDIISRGFKLRFRREEDMLFVKLKYSDPQIAQERAKRTRR